jgi:hypothetical protein
MKIQDEFPELSENLSEMPVKNADSNGISARSLTDYYNSLDELFQRFSKTH